MKRVPKALFGFQKLYDEQFFTMASIIYNAMKNNPYFEAPEPELEGLKTVIDKFKNAMAVSKGKRSPYDTAVKNETRKEVEKVLAELSFYVNKVSEGNLPILLSSGFPMSGDHRRPYVPERVEGVCLLDGRQSGQIVLRFEVQENIRMYEYRYASEKDDDGKYIWSNIFKTSSSQGNLIVGAVPGEYYFVKVRAINSTGTGEWSEPVSMMAR